MADFDTVDQARVLQFRANVNHLYQQKGSKLKGLIREETITGKAHFFERLAGESAVRKTTRHADTILLDPQHSRRMVVPVDYIWNALVDQQDKIRLLIDPNSEYAIAAANAMQRAYDDEVITAFTADAAGGEAGGTAVTFASETSSDTDPSAAAITTANILTVKRAFDGQDVPSDNRVFIVKPSVITQLLANATAPMASSSDYNSVKALVQGELDTWVGFKWVTSTRMTLAAGTDYYNIAFHRDSIGVVVAKDIMARLSERADKDYAIQSYASMTMGATRIQGAGVARMRHDDNL